MTTPGLRRGIFAVLSIKIFIVVLAALLVFGPRQRPLIDDKALNHKILSDSQQ